MSIEAWMASTVASTASSRETMRDELHEMLPARTAVERMTPGVTRLTET